MVILPYSWVDLGTWFEAHSMIFDTFSSSTVDNWPYYSQETKKSKLLFVFILNISELRF